MASSARASYEENAWLQRKNGASDDRLELERIGCLTVASARWAKKCALLEHISAWRGHLAEVETIHDFEGMEPTAFICSSC